MVATMLIIWVVGTILSLVAMYLMLRVWYAPVDEEVDAGTDRRTSRLQR